MFSVCRLSQKEKCIQSITTLFSKHIKTLRRKHCKQPQHALYRNRVLRVRQLIDMPTSPVKTRIPLTSFGHLISEVKRQLFGIDAPTPTELTGWKKHFNSYTIQGRRNFVLATYGVLALTAAVYMLRHSRKQEHETASASS
ncbi:hypothetical protein QQF64_001543 [Cirrhinus molitorella]|uniref:Uncharacterized protein n=2 Tax=Cirrhinus molitorella TaxID=172907 RepID=A0ABR3P0S0_9TELE